MRLRNFLCKQVGFTEYAAHTLIRLHVSTSGATATKTQALGCTSRRWFWQGKTSGGLAGRRRTCGRSSGGQHSSGWSSGRQRPAARRWSRRLWSTGRTPARQLSPGRRSRGRRFRRWWPSAGRRLLRGGRPAAIHSGAVPMGVRAGEKKFALYILLDFFPSHSQPATSEY